VTNDAHNEDDTISSELGDVSSKEEALEPIPEKGRFYLSHCFINITPMMSKIETPPRFMRQSKS